MIIKQMARDLKLSESFIMSTVYSANHRYKTYQIDKKDGGKRTIDHPAKRLKVLQRWVAKKIFARLPIHDAAVAYRENLNIKYNADQHAGQRFLLRMDFQDFFPSITERDVSWLIDQRAKYLPMVEDIDDVNIICRIVCKSGRLVIGAPSSPILSNCVMHDFDEYWYSLCRDRNMQYTRYADDISISTNDENYLSKIVDEMRVFLKNMDSPRLELHNEKIRHSSKKRRMPVTGLILTTDGRVSIGRKKKRFIRSLIFKNIRGVISNDERWYLVGYLNFVRSVEPDFLEALRRKYGAREVDRILEIQMEAQARSG